MQTVFKIIILFAIKMVNLNKKVRLHIKYVSSTIKKDKLVFNAF